MIGGLFAGAAARPLAGLAGAGLLLAAGFAAGVGWEHRRANPPLTGWLLGDSLAVQRDAAVRESGRLGGEVRAANDRALAWARREGDCRGRRERDRLRAEAAVPARSAEAQAAAGDAYDQGFAAGRAAGRASCRINGGTNVGSTEAGGLLGRGAGAAGRSGGADAGVRDDGAGTDAWNAGAYRPG